MRASAVTLFLCGDVMTGRGIDQILPQPSLPDLREPCVSDARAYVELAERINGPLPRCVDPAYVWGDALAELEHVAPAARIVNLETAVTTSDAYWPGKPVHYRMHPANVDCLTAARIDVCALANNHVLDCGYVGLAETIDTLRAAGIRTAGVGLDASEAYTPAIIEVGRDRRVAVFSLGSPTSGIPDDWAAAEDRSGVCFLRDLSNATADRVLDRVARVAGRGDVVIASIHWGSNWGYAVPRAQTRFAHRLLDGGVALVHGHSSHHARPIETYRGRLILYGCGDLLTDYEGIGGYEQYRGDLALLYFPTLGDSGELVELRMTPVRIRRFQVTRATPSEAEWLRQTLGRASEPYGTRLEASPTGMADTPQLVLRPP